MGEIGRGKLLFDQVDERKGRVALIAGDGGVSTLQPPPHALGRNDNIACRIRTDVGADAGDLLAALAQMFMNVFDKRDLGIDGDARAILMIP